MARIDPEHVNSPARTALRRGRRLLQGGLAVARVVRRARARSRARDASMSGLSPRLREFVDELPEERDTVLAFVSSVASQLPAGTRILDAGAGNAPYRELFAHCDYVTADWENSPHEHASVVDVRGSLESLPLEDASFDAVLSTQVLEHVAEPLAVLRELYRITRPGGRVFLTVPLVWELHEEPFDYFRYTPHGLGHLLTAAGYVVESVTARNGYFTTLASLARTATWTIWSTDGGQEAERTVIDRLLRRLADVLPAFDELDEVRRLPLGYACVASRPRQ